MKKITLVLATLTALASANLVHAQSDIGFKGIGGRLSLVNLSGGGYAGFDGGAYDLGSALGISAVADLGKITPNIAVEGYLTYWSASDEYTVTGPSLTNPFATQQYTSEWTVRDIVVGGRARYQFETSNPRFRPFAGAGLGLHLVKYSFSSNTVGEESASIGNSDFAVDLGGGVGYEISPNMDLTGELWYSMTNVSQLSIGAGVVYWLSGSAQ